MIANIYIHELRTKRRSVIIWTLSMAALVVVFFSIFTSFAAEADVANQLLAKFPQELRDAFGLGKINLSSVLGYFGFLFVFVQLCTAIQAGNYGFGLVSIEESELTADFLLTKPVSRVRIITSKLLAAFTSLLVTDFLVVIASIYAIYTFKGDREFDAAALALLFLSLLIFQVFFLALGLLISLFVKRIHNVTPFSLGLAFGAYVLNAFSGVFGEVKLEYITPFKHFDPNYIILNKGFDTAPLDCEPGDQYHLDCSQLLALHPSRHPRGFVRRWTMNIFFRELKANLKSLTIWSVVLVLFIVTGTAKFSAYAGDESMLKVIDAMPKAMLDAFSMRSFNLTTLLGFFGLMFVFFALLGAMAAAMWGSDIISKEERRKTVEFSLVLPVSRSKVITAKALAALVNCIIYVLITWGISLLMAQTYNPDQEFKDFLALEMQGMFVIELIFLAVGLLLGCAMKKYKVSGSTAIAIILGTYFLSVFSGMQEKLDFLKYFSPFKYFDAAEIYRTGKLDGMYLLLLAGIIVVCVAAAYYTYNKRDLYI